MTYARGLLCIAAVGVIAVLVVLASLLNPDNKVLAISQSSGGKYEEMVVIHRNRTYEQLFRKKSDGSVISHSGTWLPSKEDPMSRSLSLHIGTQDSDNYITFKNKISENGKSEELQKVDSSMEQPFGWSDPDAKVLSVLKEWRSKAKPFPVK